MPNTHLMDILGFTANDLAANRNGHLSASQEAKLWRKLSAIFAGYGLIAMGFIVFFLYSVADASREPFNAASLISVFVSGAGSVVFLTVIIYQWSQVQQDLNKGQAVSVEGKVALRVMETRTPRYKLQLRNLELEIPKSAYQGLTDGKIYRIYYSPKSRTILSIEHSASDF
jgi:hypothetical protein